MKSNWETLKAKSAYHFDPTQLDTPPYVMEYLGQIKPVWAGDLDTILAGAKPATWATRGYKGEGVEAPREDLAAEEYDLEAAGYGKDFQITHLNWQLPESLKKVSKDFGLADCMERIHVQMPGEVWNLHIDKLNKWAPDKPDSVMRIFIQLTDWQPGQFWEYGNYHWNQWRAGYVTTFNWQDIPHSTANAGFQPRATLQLTGIRTDKTEQYLSTLR
jgi:hypothetical protein